MEKELKLAGSARPELLNPFFWVGTDELVMTQAEIARYNRYLLSLPGSGLVDLSAFPFWLDGDAVRRMIESYPIGGCFLDGLPIGAADRAALLAARNLDHISPKVPVEYGVTLCPADVRSFPTRAVCSTEGGAPTSQSFDLFQESQLGAGEGVIILHRSSDRGWYFAQAANYFGWVPASQLRLVSRVQFLAALNSHAAPIPYTTGNLYREALSLAGTPYRWGRFDCSALVLAVYARFGLHLPRNTGQMDRIDAHRRPITKNRLEAVCSLRPGALLLMPGHVMLYLGCVEGEPYVLQAFTRYSDRSGREHSVFTTAVTSIRDIYHRSGQSFLERVTAGIEIMPLQP